MIQDQFAFRPTGSTCAALIDLLQKTTDMLRVNKYAAINRSILQRHSTGFNTTSYRRNSYSSTRPYSQQIDGLFQEQGPFYQGCLCILSHSLDQCIHHSRLRVEPVVVCRCGHGPPSTADTIS